MLNQQQPDTDGNVSRLLGETRQQDVFKEICLCVQLNFSNIPPQDVLILLILFTLSVKYEATSSSRFVVLMDRAFKVKYLKNKNITFHNIFIVIAQVQQKCLCVCCV